MRKEEYKLVKHERKENVIVSIKCDGCGKDINKDSKDHISFSGHHSEWSNDSEDSLIYYDICSPMCLSGALRKALEDFEDYHRSGEIMDFKIKNVIELVDYLTKLEKEQK